MIPRYTNDKPKTYSSYLHIEKTNPQLLDPNREEKQEAAKDLLAIQDGPVQDTIKKENKLAAPTLLLTGHEREVLCCKFSPDGKHLATAGYDRGILLWDVYNNCNNTAVLKGHKNAVLELHWSTDGTKMYTCSADKTLSCFDVETNKRIRKFIGHNSFVNSCFPARRGLDLIVSGGDDNFTRVWDVREKLPVHNLESKYQVTSVTFNDTADKVFAAGLDNQIKLWDLRKEDVEYVLYGHTDTITGMALSPEGSYLLSNSMDQSVRCWDVKSFVVGNRCVKIFQGNSHGHDKNLLKVAWSNDCSMMTAGSADQ